MVLSVSYKTYHVCVCVCVCVSQSVVTRVLTGINKNWAMKEVQIMISMITSLSSHLNSNSVEVYTVHHILYVQYIYTSTVYMYMQSLHV